MLNSCLQSWLPSSDASGEELVAAFTPSLWWRYDVDGMTALTRRVRGGWLSVHASAVPRYDFAADWLPEEAPLKKPPKPLSRPRSLRSFALSITCGHH